MFSELTPRTPIPNGRVERVMQPWIWVRILGTMQLVLYSLNYRVSFLPHLKTFAYKIIPFQKDDSIWSWKEEFSLDLDEWKGKFFCDLHFFCVKLFPATYILGKNWHFATHLMNQIFQFFFWIRRTSLPVSDCWILIIEWLLCIS